MNENILNLKKEIQDFYTDLVDIITIDRNPTPESTKNGLMHSGLLICIYKSLNILNESDIGKFIKVVRYCEESKGLYSRYPAYLNIPINKDANAHDDYTGVFAASVLSDQTFHKEILSHGIQNWFIYNNQNPGVFINGLNPLKWNWWAFRLRRIDQIIWYYLANKKFNLLGWILFFFIFVRTSSHKPSPGRILDYMIIESLCVNSNIWRMLKIRFLKKALFYDSMKEYFKEQHPLYKLSFYLKTTSCF